MLSHTHISVNTFTRDHLTNISCRPRIVIHTPLLLQCYLLIIRNNNTRKCSCANNINSIHDDLRQSSSSIRTVQENGGISQIVGCRASSVLAINVNMASLFGPGRKHMQVPFHCGARMITSN